ncbi:hypothetical protein KI387_024246, partial [Taxus chinensis]
MISDSESDSLDDVVVKNAPPLLDHLVPPDPHASESPDSDGSVDWDLVPSHSSEESSDSEPDPPGP